jgi:hypothetical protein
VNVVLATRQAVAENIKVVTPVSSNRGTSV